jgi:hypothetical protein
MSAPHSFTRPKRRKYQILLAGCLLVVLAVLVLRPDRERTNDEQKYRQMLRAEVWGGRLTSAEKQLPGPMVRLFHVAEIKKSQIEKAQSRADALLVSGYLTNTWITITNLPVTATNEKSRIAEVRRRLRAGLGGVDSWAFYMESNQAFVTCRSIDLPHVRRAIEGW